MLTFAALSGGADLILKLSSQTIELFKNIKELKSENDIIIRDNFLIPTYISIKNYHTDQTEFFRKLQCSTERGEISILDAYELLRKTSNATKTSRDELYALLRAGRSLYEDLPAIFPYVASCEEYFFRGYNTGLSSPLRGLLGSVERIKREDVDHFGKITISYWPIQLIQEIGCIVYYLDQAFPKVSNEYHKAKLTIDHKIGPPKKS